MEAPSPMEWNGTAVHAGAVRRGLRSGTEVKGFHLGQADLACCPVNTIITDRFEMTLPLAQIAAPGALHDFWAGASRFIPDEAAEVAQMPSSLSEGELVAARELLATTSREDFDDVLQFLLTSIDEWTGTSRTRNLTHANWSRALGVEFARVEAAYRRIVDGQPPRRRHHKRPGLTWSTLLYSEEVPPQVRIRMCEFMMGHAAHLALLLGIERAAPLPAHVADGIASALERSASAVESLTFKKRT